MVSTSCLRSIIMGKAYHENSVLSTEISMCSRIQLEVQKWNPKCIQPGSNLLMSFFSFSTPSTRRRRESVSGISNKVSFHLLLTRRLACFLQYPKFLLYHVPNDILNGSLIVFDVVT